MAARRRLLFLPLAALLFALSALVPSSGRRFAVQLPAVQAHPAAGVEAGLDMGQEGDHLVHHGRADDGARRLLAVQGGAGPAALLPQGPRGGGPAPLRALQRPDRQLLQGRRARLLGAGPRRRRRLLPVQRRPGRHLQPQRPGAAQLHAQGPRARLHLRARQGRPAHPVRLPGRPEVHAGAHDVERDVYVFSVRRAEVADVLRLALVVLQRHHCPLPDLLLRLPEQQQGNSPYLASVVNGDGKDSLVPLVECTPHMCPIRVHWHVKVSYREYWRVKITVTNFNYRMNYSRWNLVSQHPNFDNLTTIFSFNYKALNPYGTINDTAMLWGIKYYNDLLMTAGPDGNVQSELLFRKDAATFTFQKGWAFPRRVYFNGDNCVMPPPDAYPWLPNASPRLSASLVLTSIAVWAALVLLQLVHA